MAKEFDIYLRRHLVECDLLVYSIPYRDGISVTNRLVLEAFVHGLAMRRFAAVQMGLELESHVNQVGKHCLEKPSAGIFLGTSAELQVLGKLYFEDASTIIDVPDIPIVEQVMIEAANGVVVHADPLFIQSSSSTGAWECYLTMDANVEEVSKQSLLNVIPVILPNAEILQISQIDFICADTMSIVDSTIQSLCYQSEFDAVTSVEISAFIVGTEILHSLGVWYNGVTLGSNVDSTLIRVFVSAQAVTAIVQAAEGILIKVMYPSTSFIITEDLSLVADMKRYRLLSDLDDLDLDDIDDMTFAELEFIWIT